MILQKSPAFYCLWFFLTIQLAACVSVNLKPKGPTKSKTFQYSPPSSGFQKREDDHADLSFKDLKTGHTIAMISECSESRDPDLQSLENEIIQNLADVQKLKTENLVYNERQALRSLYSGSIDGVAVLIETMIFKKNACAYTITLMGRKKFFENRQAEFQKFIEGFKVP